ncbi:aminoglycoside 3'-phosphotransferase [Nonomuraea pusilla]|uniref:Kanamycin kinase n=1 Tax=Nonomuraea pusilla TaxID=46177 RepID=A0A1H7N6K2_9ACTN|nr:aminoglycoside 3'-phosphotransferase [Nonomuraea pusilla]SEL19133.1 kanamycin kinase [Nonomuraea pusilla]
MQLPGRIHDLFGEGAVWSDDHGGMSGETWRVTSPSGVWYVKRGRWARREAERLLWLKRWAAVPDVVAAEDDVLVLADAGLPSLEGREADPVAGAVMGRALRALHAIPVAECPFDERLDVKLEQARVAVESGLVDPGDFDDDHTPEHVYERLLRERPPIEDLVVAHGDFTPANVLADVLADDAGGPVLIDAGRLGVCDRHVDLAIALRELEGPAVASFLEAYGPPAPDPRRVEYYRLLDELF